jgi:hypothetical protein
MKLGINQPYFFPYIGYFQLINAVDHWIVFDTCQFIWQGWVNRNRIIRPNGAVEYIRINVRKCPRDTAIKDIMISTDVDWKNQVIRSLDYYKLIKAPYYQDVMDFLTEAFRFESDRLSPVLVHLLKSTCDYLGIPFRYSVLSEMNLNLENVHGPGEWALEMSKAMKATTYINAPGGKAFHNYQQFKDAGIELLFIEPGITPYDQKKEIFEPGLSILDVMMFNSPEQIREMLKNFTLSTNIPAESLESNQ